MGKAMYINTNNQIKKVKNIYINVNNQVRKVKKGYVNVNGVVRLFYDASSTRGIWTEGTMPSSSNWTSVAFGKGKFVAVASGSVYSAYSYDGITWYTSTLPKSTSWNRVRFCNDRFIAISSGGAVIYSIDGITWTAATLPISVAWSDIGYNAEKGYYVIISNNTSSSTLKGLYSMDGTTWKQTTLQTPISSITYGNGKIIGVKTNTGSGNTIIINSSSNPANPWSAGTNMFPTGSDHTVRSWYDIIYGNDRFIAVASGGKTSYSLTGNNGSFTEVSSSITSTLRSIAYGNGMFIAVANNDSQSICSNDGTEWSTSIMPASRQWRSVAFGNGVFVAVAYGSDKNARIMF